MTRLAGLLAVLITLSGCAGSAKTVATTDDRYCGSVGFSVGSDQYAECRLRQTRLSGDR